MYNNKKVIIVLPAYNAESTLEKTITSIPKEYVDEIILVDDFSTDNTVSLSKKLGLITIRHKKNKGYGANQKTCYKEALKRGADIVVMIHPDYQYDPKILNNMIIPIAKGKVDSVFASRFLNKKDPLKGGMPYYKYVGNRVLTFFENLILRTSLSEFHTGYRSFSRNVLENISIYKNSDNFVFDTQIIIQMIIKKYKIKEVAVETRYFKEASSIDLKASIVYGLSIFRELCKFLLTKWNIKKYSIYS
ncbi:MAG: glycosyltransferase family 2 protein [archaeon]|nr:glycosyltransferase family 2 protein [archaeon]MDD2477632.1 glycosyltransferase family 2 protein [Candidatus ainarchaeum sp.]MDD3084273.1 glycosyltransferase family 2 protein [Candidatus ainarchaeum sp.]MDD4221014.1 glycosyltransferase family 2 protein [Candidatus ainarchaeum sp.]MDD4662486.1 glycosyltransferase family 2 protein [Candidatus ainarchaeum sp.]